jgi:uncharacterized damage-inducible protein DinB
MKQHLLSAFSYNKWATLKLIECIETIKDQDESLKLVSHLISAQDKWYNRITKEKEDAGFLWFGEIYPIHEIKEAWCASIDQWITYLESLNESDLDNFLRFTNPSNGKKMQLKIKDLMLQLNYHCIHHRAQVNTLISKQGIKPPPTDYIFTVLSEIETNR